MGAALKFPTNAWPAGKSANPGGRKPATPEEREAKRLLREKSIKAARKLIALIDSEDERMAYAASVAVLGYSEVARVEDDATPTAAELAPEELAAQFEAAAKKLRNGEKR